MAAREHFIAASCEIAFVFDNGELCVNLTGGRPDALALAERVSSA